MTPVPALTLAAVLLWSASAQAADWVVDLGKSRLGFIGSQAGSPFEGRFGRWTAKISLDPANPAAGKAVVEIDMASAATGDGQKDESLPQGDWFDAKAFPQARFEATSFRAKGGTAFEAVGSLSIRGMKKDVVLPFTLDITGPAAHAKGRLDLIRTDYGVGQGAWKAADMVALEVAVTIDLVAATAR
ncbi:MAG: YceI family protein [Phaeospirillum sp.]|nr:YceI family protein [Phaeospirillum sp.]